MELTLQTTTWHAYRDIYHQYDRQGVVGDLRVAQDVHSPELNNRRDIVVYLPPGYAQSAERYPVLYMQDGQNLFDPATSFAGEWAVDQTMEQLSYSEQLAGIVVAIPNMGVERLNEYGPFVDKHHGGGHGLPYVNFLADTLKPLIDASFRTRPEPHATGVMGSSMGGLISLYAFFRRPDIFGFAGAMSPSLWFANGAIFTFVENAHFNPGKLYLDAGTREMGGNRARQHKREQSRRYYASVRRMKRVLVRKGYRPLRDILHVEEQWAGHNESAWNRRLPRALSFFLQQANAN